MKAKTIVTVLLLLFTAISFAQNKEHKEYYDSGKETGEWTTYYEDGRVYSIIPYKNGLIEGEIRVYNEYGKLISSDKF